MTFSPVQAAMSTALSQLDNNNPGDESNMGFSQEEKDRRREVFYKRSKRIICFAAFLATLGFVTSIVNALLAFLHELLDNDKILSTMQGIMEANKQMKE